MMREKHIRCRTRERKVKKYTRAYMHKGISFPERTQLQVRYMYASMYTDRRRENINIPNVSDMQLPALQKI